MNKWIKIITSLMIIILIALLILIFLNYFNNREIINIINSNNTNNIHASGENAKDEKENIDIVVSSGEKENFESGEITDEPIVEQIQDEKKPDPTNKTDKKTEIKPQADEKPKDNNSVISSNVDTSNEEKRQVLNELDSALKGLLDVVSKVPTVDEEKLDASLKESEVSP